MKRLLLILFCSFLYLLPSCKREPLTDTDPNLPLYIMLDGNYNIIEASSTTEEDINRDGIFSKNMLTEIPNIQNSDFDIIINNKNKSYRLNWPEQIPTQVNEPGGTIYFYTINGTWVDFSFDNESKQLKTKASVSDINVDNRIFFHLDTIRVLLSRKLKTSSGEKTVIINAVYKKNESFKRPYNH
jgi:hypothetical protein